MARLFQQHSWFAELRNEPALNIKFDIRCKIHHSTLSHLHSAETHKYPDHTLILWTSLRLTERDSRKKMKAIFKIIFTIYSTKYCKNRFD